MMNDIVERLRKPVEGSSQRDVRLKREAVRHIELVEYQLIDLVRFCRKVLDSGSLQYCWHVNMKGYVENAEIILGVD